MSSEHKILSVIIPVYNEERTILQLLDKVIAAKTAVSMEVIIINDGSTDRTAELCREWLKTHNGKTDARLIFLERPNGGKGAAVKTGITHSTGDVVIIQDADLEYDPNDYQQCIAPILHGECKVVYGSREADNRNRMYSSPSFFLGGLALTWWIDLLYNAELTDEPTCYKTFDGKLIRSIPIEGNHFEWEPEITAKLLRMGYEIREVGISYHPRKTTEGKKIKWFDGLQGLWIALYWRFASIASIRKNTASVSNEFAQIQTVHKRNMYWFIGIFLFAFLLRVLFALPGFFSPGQQLLIRSDSYPFLHAAGPGIFKTMPTFHQLYPACIRKADPKQPEYKRIMNSQTRAPLYTIWLSILFGISGHSLIFAALAGCFLGALSCMILFAAGHLFGSTEIGIAAALLLAVCPTAIAFSPIFLPDTLFVFLISLQTWFFLRFTKNRFGINLIASIIFAAFGSLIRPVNALWIIPCVIVLGFYKSIPSRLRFNYMLTALILFCLILFPWLWSAKIAGIGWRIDTISSEALMKNTVLFEAKLKNTKVASVQYSYNQELLHLYEKDPAKYSVLANQLDTRDKLMLSKLLQHPFQYALTHLNPRILVQDLRGILLLLGPRGNSRYAVLGFYFFSVLLSIAVLLGLAWFLLAADTFRKLFYNFLLFLLHSGYYLLMPGLLAIPRYQLPALPFIFLAAGYGLIYMRAMVKEGKGPAGLIK